MESSFKMVFKMSKDIPDVFEGIVEVDEACFGGQKKNNGLEGFLGYLKRQLASRGGIKKERLPFLHFYMTVLL